MPNPCTMLLFVKPDMSYPCFFFFEWFCHTHVWFWHMYSYMQFSVLKIFWHSCILTAQLKAFKTIEIGLLIWSRLCLVLWHVQISIVKQLCSPTMRPALHLGRLGKWDVCFCKIFLEKCYWSWLFSCERVCLFFPASPKEKCFPWKMEDCVFKTQTPYLGKSTANKSLLCIFVLVLTEREPVDMFIPETQTWNVPLNCKAIRS